MMFRFISPFEGKGDTNTFTDTRQTPTQNFVNDLSWFKGRHTMKVGTNIRFTRVPKNRFQASYLSATINPSWVAGIGRRNMPGSAFCTVPGCSLPAVATAFQAGYADAWLNIIGVLSQATQRANYNQDGTPQAPGTRGGARDRVGRIRVVHPGRVAAAAEPDRDRRRCATASTRRPTKRTACRWRRRSAWASGSTSARRTRRTASRRAPARSSPSIWPARRTTGRASTPGTRTTSRRASRWRGRRRSAWCIRGGYSKVFDRVGVGLATNFDEGFAFGMSTQISSPFGAAYETNPARALRQHHDDAADHAGGAGGWIPADAAARAGIITSSIDDTLVTPSAHMTSAIVGYDLSRNYSIEVGYIGRFGRDMLVRRDLAMPLNLVDPASRTDYFTAAQTIINAAQAAGITGGSRGRRLRRTPGGGVLGEHLPWRGRRRADCHAGDYPRVHAERARLDHRPLRHGHRVLAGVQQVRTLRVLRRTVRFARRDQLDRPRQLQRHERVPAPALR